MWIARDKDGLLNLHIDRPYKFSTHDGYWKSEFNYPIPVNLFPEVQWSDKEPRELILK